MAKIRVLVVDDSILFRETLSKALNNDPAIQVIAMAGDAYEARDKILSLNPDVMTLDVEMPKMNGIEFLKKLIPQYPMPVVVVSASPINAFDAIDAGAVDYIKKPTVKTTSDMQSFAEELCSKIKIAKTARLSARGQTQRIVEKPVYSVLNAAKHSKTVIALGASTGGTDALQVVVQNLPKTTPGIVIVQHMPAGFTKMYADRLNRICQMSVKEAQNGDRVEQGTILVGAGEFQMKLCKDIKGYYVHCARGEKVSGHCPSVDVLFDSVADVAGSHAIGAILTGMGSDGAKGLLKMKKAGAYTIGQDENSCVVYGMPMVAYNIGAVMKQAPLQQIPNLIMDKLK